MSSQPLPFKLNDDNLKRMIRETAAETARVFIVVHARKRMRERNITPTQVYDCLRNGNVSEPAHVNIHGNWQCTLTRRHAGDEITAVAALERAEDGNWVAVVTVY
ncbi:MAG TPA: DUF4258 domain-containing protein [Paraburkholderia sp.]